MLAAAEKRAALTAQKKEYLSKCVALLQLTLCTTALRFRGFSPPLTLRAALLRSVTPSHRIGTSRSACS